MHASSYSSQHYDLGQQLRWQASDTNAGRAGQRDYLLACSDKQQVITAVTLVLEGFQACDSWLSVHGHMPCHASVG